MIQVDVFWSFAMGAAFAAMAAEGIKRSNSMFINKYFVYNISFLSMIFAPSGIYLLWQHTGWETMFFFDRSLHGIWPCLFAHTNVSLGVIGFCVCYHLIKSGNEQLTHALWTGAYTCMFAILSIGYDRFLYSGNMGDWRALARRKPIAFFSSKIFKTLLVMSAFVLPPIFYALYNWPSEYGMTGKEKSKLIKTALRYYAIFTAIVFSLLCVAILLRMTPIDWGIDRVFAFLVGQTVFGAILFAPLLFITTEDEVVSSVTKEEKQGKSVKQKGDDKTEQSKQKTEKSE